MKQALLQFRLEWLDRMWILGVVLQIVNIVYCVYQHFTVANSNTINLVLAADTFLLMVIWTILKFLKKSWTLYIPVIFLIIHVIDINMVFADKLYPPSLIIDDKTQYKEQLMIYFLLTNLVNFMEFKHTFLIILPIYLCG